MQGNTGKSSLVAKEETQLCKSPGGMTRTLGTSNRALGSLPNVPEFLNRYSLMVSLGLLNNAFGDDMIAVFAETGFTPREFLEMAFGRLRPTLLQTLTKRMVALACLLNRLATKRLTLAIRSQIDDAQVNTQDITGFIGCRFRDIRRHGKVESALTVNQVALSVTE